MVMFIYFSKVLDNFLLTNFRQNKAKVPMAFYSHQIQVDFLTLKVSFLDLLYSPWVPNHILLETHLKSLKPLVALASHENTCPKYPKALVYNYSSAHRNHFPYKFLWSCWNQKSLKHQAFYMTTLWSQYMDKDRSVKQSSFNSGACRFCLHSP